MSHKKHGQLTTSSEWARHLRPLLRRWFWKGERRAAREMLRSGSDQTASGEASHDSVEALLNEMALWPEHTAAADLWVPDELTLRGRSVANDVGMAIVLNSILRRGLSPSGFSEGLHGRLYHFKRS